MKCLRSPALRNRSIIGRRSPAVLTVVGVCLWGAGTTAATIDFDHDLTDDAGVTAIMGHATADDGSLGTAHTQNDDPVARLIDNDSSTRVQSWARDEVGTAPDYLYDYAGVVFDSPRDGVAAIRFYHATFSDGGWFLVPGVDYDTDSRDFSEGLVAPRVQVTTDGGVTWTEVTGASDDYQTVINADTMPGYDMTRPPVTFTFDPVNGINGIRIFGDGAGPAGPDQTGFIGINEFEVFAIPEPASLALLAVGGVLALGRRRES